MLARLFPTPFRLSESLEKERNDRTSRIIRGMIRLKYYKRFFIVTILIFLVIMTIAIFIFLKNFSLFDRIETTDSGQIVLESEFGDSFLIKYRTINVPDLDTKVEIFNYEGDRIELFHLDGLFESSELILLLDQPELRCYEIYGNILLYKTDQGNFKSQIGSGIDSIDVVDHPDLIFVGEKLGEAGSVKWKQYFSEFLLKADRGS